MNNVSANTGIHSSSQPSKLRVIAIRTVLILVVGSLGGSFIVMVYGTLSTNRITKAMHDFPVGTPISAVIEKYGEPDRVDPVDGSWKYGRRLRKTSDSIRSVAVYSRNTAPQICTYFLDSEDCIVEIEVFASY